ncbi:DUF6705 family protein [Ferruginibacter yonginensis]|uniref:DUF6705 family protein n=1 Tax=Ferruginibacter yonginensis TaxID=1310416 RepID=UPI0036D21900
MALIFIGHIIYAQYPDNGDNIFYPQLNKFEGTWKYSNGNTEVILILKKKHITTNFANGESYQADEVHGVLKVKISNNTIFDNTTELNELLTNSLYKPKISVNVDCFSNNYDVISGYMRDVTKQKGVELKLTYQNTNTPTLLLKQINEERFGLINLDGTVISEDLSNPNGTFDPIFTIPNNIVLVKQP